jgi:5,5'-dehydrodivanillate O-demethylase oxygenase subunit
LFALDGRCLEQPAETTVNQNLRIKAYAAQEVGGLIFTYMGPLPAPQLPCFDLFVMKNCVRDIGHTLLDFNWLQAMENSVDPLHAEWLHGHFSKSVRERAGLEMKVNYGAKKHQRIAFTPFEYGIIKRRILEGGSEEDDGWKIGHPLVFPYQLRIGGPGFQQFQMRVPIDDTHTWHIWYTAYTPDTDDLPEQSSIPGYVVPWRDEQGEYILDYIDGQDIAAWAGQGTIADRTKELLGASDKGVVTLRKMFKEQLEAIAQGKDPLGVVRDPAVAACIDLPTERHKAWADSKSYILGLLDAQAVRYSPQNGRLVELFKRHGVRAVSKGVSTL